MDPKENRIAYSLYCGHRGEDNNEMFLMTRLGLILVMINFELDECICPKHRFV